MIPKEVMKASESRKHLGGELRKIGTYNGRDVYSYIYREPVTIGYPELYVWNGKDVEVVKEEEALLLQSAISEQH